MNKRIIALTFLTGLLLRLLMGLQGIDHTDAGFSNTFYLNIFEHPASMPYNFNYYLTGLLGGIWQQLFGGMGLQGFRVLEALTLTGAIFFSYMAFRRQIASTGIAAAAILLSFLFPSIVITFHYNTLSFLLMALATWLYALSLQRAKDGWLYLSAMVIGISIFARIVNGVLLGAIIIPFLQGWHQQSLRRGLIRATTFAGGAITGIALVLLLMLSLGHLPVFIEGFTDAFGFFSEGGNSHASGNLFFVYLKSYVNLALQMLILALLGMSYAYIREKKRISVLLLNFLFFIAVLVLTLTSLPYLTALGGCTLLCIILLASEKIENGELSNPQFSTSSHKWTIGYAIALTFLFPFGSDIGVPGIYHWIAALMIMPAATTLIENGEWRMENYDYTPNTNSSRKSNHNSQFSILNSQLKIVSLSIALCMLGKIMSKPYGEEHSRLECTKTVQDGRLNTLTTADNVAVYREVIAQIEAHAADNPWLVLGNQASELFYATGRLPFLGNTQLGTYTGEALIRRLDNRFTQYHVLPTVVFLKDRQFVQDDDESEQVQATLRRWMASHDYETAFDNQHLTIFTFCNHQE